MQRQFDSVPDLVERKAVRYQVLYRQCAAENQVSGLFLKID
jgi:hypothetical protein